MIARLKIGLACLIELHWVRALTVPINLGGVDWTFVPHHLILAQQSPVPLPKF